MLTRLQSVQVPRRSYDILGSMWRAAPTIGASLRSSRHYVILDSKSPSAPPPWGWVPPCILAIVPMMVDTSELDITWRGRILKLADRGPEWMGFLLPLYLAWASGRSFVFSFLISSSLQRSAALELLAYVFFNFASNADFILSLFSLLQRSTVSESPTGLCSNSDFSSRFQYFFHSFSFAATVLENSAPRRFLYYSEIYWTSVENFSRSFGVAKLFSCCWLSAWLRAAESEVMPRETSELDQFLYLSAPGLQLSWFSILDRGLQKWKLTAVAKGIVSHENLFTRGLDFVSCCWLSWI